MKAISPQASVAKLRKLSTLRPQLAIVTGTGLAGALDRVVPDARASYEEIPGFVPSSVTGHPGELIIGRLANEPIIVLAGRSHYYEGHSMSMVAFAVRALAAYGVRALILTNAAGGINPRLRPGEFMLLRDHINFMGANPLRGAVADHLPCFVDLTQVYDPGLTRLLQRAGKACGVKVRSGVYLAVSGPSYETPAEIRAFRLLGADAVGMSTVPEAITARQCGLKVAALSCITNRAAGLGGPLSHREVLETSSKVQESAGKLLFHFARLYGRSAQD
jgi:purine-nucleoside phosphorylase